MRHIPKQPNFFTVVVKAPQREKPDGQIPYIEGHVKNNRKDYPSRVTYRCCFSRSQNHSSTLSNGQDVSGIRATRARRSQFHEQLRNRVFGNARHAHGRADASLPAGYVFRAKLVLILAEGASFNTIKRRLQNQCSHHHPLETALPPIRARWAGHLSSRPEGHGSDSGFAGPDSVGHPQETQRRCHALELPQTGDSAGSQQGRCASGVEASRSEASPPGALPGQRRSRVLTQRGRHSRFVRETKSRSGSPKSSPGSLLAASSSRSLTWLANSAATSTRTLPTLPPIQ